jgi:hypothetical protein
VAVSRRTPTELRGLDRHDGYVLPPPPAGYLLVLWQQDVIRRHNVLVQVRVLGSLIIEAVG